MMIFKGVDGMKHCCKSNKPRFYIYGAFILLVIIAGGLHSMVFSDGGLIPNVYQGELLNLNTLTTQWLTTGGHISAISLIAGKIAIFTPQNGLQDWAETQRFGPDDILFTTFQVKDIDNDGVAEIIAGTAEPGFIYIYKLNNDQWELFNYGKYVWSAVTYIAVGDFCSEPGNGILVQNQEGSLYLLKLNGNSLDLVWKSPTVWRPISSGYVLDIDNDAKDEIVVIYKSGGIGILKLASNSAVSVWENYLWGKVMAETSGDLDHDGQPEVLISTSQKVVYALGYGPDGGYQFKKQWTGLNYIVEKLIFFINNGASQILATDTAGKSHLLEYNAKNQEWVENYTVLTGRIAQIIDIEPGKALLWGYNRKLIMVQDYAAKELQLSYQGVDYKLSPAATFKNDTLYIAPAALQGITGLNLIYRNNKTNFTVIKGEQTIEVAKKNLAMKVNGNLLSGVDSPMVADGELQLPLTSYQSLFKLNMFLDSAKKQIVINEPSELNVE
jgi:hypothetical protein